jgi:hypothetical protein
MNEEIQTMNEELKTQNNALLESHQREEVKNQELSSLMEKLQTQHLLLEKTTKIYEISSNIYKSKFKNIDDALRKIIHDIKNPAGTST